MEPTLADLLTRYWHRARAEQATREDAAAITKIRKGADPMNSALAQRACRKSEVTVTPVSPSVVRIVVIRGGKTVDDCHYYFAPTPCDIGGLAVRMDRLDLEREDSYHVRYNIPPFDEVRCDCIAGENGSACKHKICVHELLALGLLPRAAAKREPEPFDNA